MSAPIYLWVVSRADEADVFRPLWVFSTEAMARMAALNSDRVSRVRVMGHLEDLVVA